MLENKSWQPEIQAALWKEFEIFRVMKALQLRTVAYRCGISKDQGVEPFSILIALVFLTFLGKSVHHFVSHCRNSLFDLGAKDVFYRLSTRTSINWRRFMMDISLRVIKHFKSFSSWQQRVLVIDDTVIPKAGKKIEELSWVFDHTKGKSVKGFSAVVLGWSDSSSFVPVDFSLQRSSRKVFNQSTETEMDKRMLAWHRRQEAVKDKPTLVKEMLKRAKQKGLDAGAVLFDSWYCMPKLVSSIFHEIGYDVIAMLKTTPTLTVVVNGKVYSTKRLWECVVPALKKETVTIGKDRVSVSFINAFFGETLVKLVFCQPSEKSKSKKPIILLSTDTSLTSERIIETYGQRWAVEVLFKEAKSKLFFGKNQSRSFEANICFLTLSLVRFIILSYMERINGDFRHKGSLYEGLRYEVEELNILAFMEKFINQLLSIIDGAKETFAFFMDKLTGIQEMVRHSIQNLLFQRCET
ncbi:MAG: transposase [Peptostreptococcales bacterium]